jgi:hypothetical protein
MINSITPKQAKRTATYGISCLSEATKDFVGWIGADPGPHKAVETIVEWLLDAQSNSKSQDGGVASHYCLKAGWASSYPETTGYIIPTLLEFGVRESSERVVRSAKAMVDWLIEIQFPDGSFQGGNIDALPKKSVVFNTGQILFGLAAACHKWRGEYEAATVKAAEWLIQNQDDDGAWRKHRSPFTTPGAKAYETHVAWALIETDRVLPNRGYRDAALRNVGWAISTQLKNGWFPSCSLGDNKYPITHTLAYTVRGILEAWEISKSPEYLKSAKLTLDMISQKTTRDGKLLGAFDDEWRAASNTVCVTGSAQFAHCFLLLYRATNEKQYLECGLKLNKFVRTTIALHGETGRRGGVKGSFPSYGDYGPFRYLNWAAKFTIDSNLEEIRVLEKN